MKRFLVRLTIGLIKKLLASFVKFNVMLKGHRQRKLDYSMWKLEIDQNDNLMIGGCNCAECPNYPQVFKTSKGYIMEDYKVGFGSQLILNPASGI